MNLTTNQQKIAQGITGFSIPTDKFKTTRISLSFVLPLTLKDAATASLLCRLLTRSTKGYPTPNELQRKLLSLYGAHFSSGMIKLGDYQLLNIGISVIDDAYALNGEQLLKEATAFLCDSVFSPNFTHGTVPKEDLEVCRRLLVEAIESTINDKRKYALSKAYAAMCPNEPFGIDIGGNIETAKSVTGEDVVDFWQNMLATAPVVVTVIGNSDGKKEFEAIQTAFDSIHRNPQDVQPAFVYQNPQSVRTVTEQLPLSQGKLVMGFRSDISSMEQDNMAFRMMCDIFGGAPYSKLFTVVREKMSLCYYCGARIQSQKGFLFVDSGVDEQNIEAAKQGILDQLQAMQQGEFDEDVIHACKMSMADGVISVTDSQSALESWYLARLFD